MKFVYRKVIVGGGDIGGGKREITGSRFGWGRVGGSGDLGFSVGSVAIGATRNWGFWVSGPLVLTV